MLPDYVVGTPYTIEKGEQKAIVVYNGNNAGYLNFKVSFSRAASLVMTGVSAVGIVFLNY